MLRFTITMECLQVTGSSGTLEIVDAPVPEGGPMDALVEVEAASVGLTVHRNVHDRIAGAEENHFRIPGHEIVGRVSEVGAGLTHVSEGDLVTNHYYLFCGHCTPCESGREPLCENLRGKVGVDVDGGYAEYVRLPGRNLVRLPDDLDPVETTVIPDAVATPVHVAERRGPIDPGDDVMILGAGGGVGIHLVQIAAHHGATVTAVDQRTHKLERCAELGAARTVNTADRSVSTLEPGYDIVVDFVGSTELAAETAELLAPGGRFVSLVGTGEPLAGFTPRKLVRGELEVVGSRYCSRSEIRRAAELVADGTVEPIISEVVELADVSSLLELIASGDHLGRGAVTP